jgi:Bifunctional DNA primase/polymerase, N-terminal/AAA domain/Primase C terminal 1 (PriCT-1)
VSRTFETAIAYRRADFSVIPIKPMEKKPLVAWEPYQKEPAPEETIKFWFSNWPDANLAIVTGAVSDCVVIDLDSEEAKEKFKSLLRSDLSEVPRSRTGKGWQLFFKHPGVNVQNGVRVARIPGLDTRGDGGYVVVPPSIHPNGKQYKWEVALSRELPKLPGELLGFLTTASSQSGAHERVNTSEALKGVPEGQRDETVFKLACKLRSVDVPRDISERLILEAAANCEPPFPERIALEKVARVYSKYTPKQREQTNSKQPGHGFSLVSAKDILTADEPETSWLWEGILPSGGMSLLVAKPKVGKTTLAFNLAIATARGAPFLERSTAQGSVVYLALEEKKGETKKKLEAAGVADEPLVFHFGSAPLEAMKRVEELIRATSAKLLIIDVLQKFCRLRDLNDYAQVANALEPLLAAARKQDCHILLTHHAGKKERPDGDDILGSTGLLGGVDTSIIIKKREKRRTFSTIQRYGDDVEETVLELDQDGTLRALGSKADLDIDETAALVGEALRNGPLNRDEILERIERNRNIVIKTLARLLDEEKITREGTGKRGDPFVYKVSVLPYSDTNGNGNTETFSPSKPVPQQDLFRIDGFHNFSTPRNGIGTEISSPETESKISEKDPWDEEDL